MAKKNDVNDDGTKRTFGSGATRDTAVGKIDPEGFLSPLVILQFSKYMNMHRVQSDGNLRDSDNWQKGIPKNICMSSMARHYLDFSLIHRGFGEHAHSPCIIAAAMGILFNLQAYILQVLEDNGLRDFDGDDPLEEVLVRLHNLGYNSLEEFNERTKS
jgi:hypothetical protein